MRDWDNVQQATIVVTNPTTSREDLLEIARLHPQLQVQIAWHPYAGPELLNWLANNGDESVREAVTARLARDAVADSETGTPVAVLADGSAPIRLYRSKRWLIVGAVLVLVVAIVSAVLIVVRSTRQPTLDADQFVALLQNNSTLFGQADLITDVTRSVSGLAPQDAVSMLPASAERITALLMQPGEQIALCQGQSDFSEALGAIEGSVNVSDFRSTHALVMLFTTPESAHSMGALLASCDSRVTAPDPLTALQSVSAVQSGVSLWGTYESDTDHLNSGLLTYDNVLIIAGEPGSWASWQDGAGEVKTAIAKAS